VADGLAEKFSKIAKVRARISNRTLVIIPKNIFIPAHGRNNVVRER